MSWITRLALAVVACSSAASTASADELVPVEVLVTNISGRSVYLNAGREAGLEPGDPVRFLPLEGGLLEGRLDAVSLTSAQFDAGPRAVDLRPGDRGVVLIPEGRRAGEVDEAPRVPPREVPDHPPWRDGPVEWSLGTPLLAPAESITPEKREQRLRGRVYDSFQATWDRNGPDRRYLSNRVGMDLTLDNPFARADGIRLRAEYLNRLTSIDGEEDETQQDFVLDRFSYYRGGKRTLPGRFELGRFLPLEFPEFGVIDGGEYSRRLESGSVVGGNVGLLPRPNDTLSNGDDVQASVFFRKGVPEDSPVTWAAGYQKTWHKGQADRDLVVLKGDWLASPRLSFFSTAWIDIYGSGDTIKSAAVELTELNVNGTYSSRSGHGASVFYTRLRWPEMLREEFQALTPDQIRNNKNDRVSLSGWLRVADPVRLSARVDHWQDQDGSGENGELRVDLRDLLYDRGNVALTVFRLGGAFRSGVGLRGTASKSLATGFLSVSLETTRFDATDSFALDDRIDQHVGRASYDWAPADLDVSVFAEQRFGDAQDAFILGVLIQKRF